MSITNKCLLCGRTYGVNSKNFHTEVAEMQDGTLLNLVWVTCPLCGREYIVSLSNEETEPLERALYDFKAKALKMSHCGQRAHKKLLNKIDAIDRKLTAMRKALVDRYNGHLYLSKTDGETKDLCYLQQYNAGKM